KRYGNRPLPAVTVVDLREELARGNRSPFSRALAESVGEALAQRSQVILFLNRRGVSSVVLCRTCGESLGCPDCSVSLTLHASQHALVCHYCGYQMPLPELCPSCGGKVLRALGAGTERVEAEARSLWTGTPSCTVTPIGRSIRPSRNGARTC
ncbi:MAG: hypothetical protein M1582_01540, partial [Actinobacteria bacterium]|nr:hypothetical protein [Actinomycetota bacterium]